VAFTRRMVVSLNMFVMASPWGLHREKTGQDPCCSV
jgi:hypothetical protein